MIRIIVELFVLYLLYKLVFDFIIPVYQASKQVKQKMGDMHRKMEAQMRQQEAATASKPKETRSTPAKEDYIEFEEIK